MVSRRSHGINREGWGYVRGAVPPRERTFPISKGGTMDYDPKASNRMVEEREDGTD